MEINLLITGGLGHIGSYLINNLPEIYNVTVVDNMFTNKYNSLFKLSKNIKFINCDFSEVSVDVLKSTDIVLHLAAITDATNPNNYEDIETTNVSLTKLFIDKCIEHSCARFIFPSSTSVYGVAADYVTENDDSFLNPQSPYAESKIEIEKYLQESTIDYVILRLGTIFGVSPGMRFHTAINKFCYQAALGEPLTVWKQNYHQYRPYLGLSDCKNGLLQVIRHKSKRETYNLITNNYRLDYIVNLIKSIKDVEVDMVKTPLLNQHSYKVDMTKIQTLGFYPRSNIHKEITRTMNLFKRINND